MGLIRLFGRGVVGAYNLATTKKKKKKCFHIGDKDTVNRSIKKKENFKRNTFLLDILKKLKIKLNKKESK